MKSTAHLPIIGMEIAKNILPLHIVDPEIGELERVKLKCDPVASLFANRQSTSVALEACGGAHHWGRVLQAQGHQIKLLPAKQVRPFVLRDKTDARDAQGIWVAAPQLHIRAVPLKSVQPQLCLCLHRIRAQLMKMRVMQTNALRGLLYDFGIALPEGRQVLSTRIPTELAKASDQLASMVIDSVLEQIGRVGRLQADIDLFEKRLVAMVK